MPELDDYEIRIGKWIRDMNDVKVQVNKPRPDYKVFLGEFSGQWVGICRINGHVEHSVQRQTADQADYAVRNGHARFERDQHRG